MRGVVVAACLMGCSFHLTGTQATTDDAPGPGDAPRMADASHGVKADAAIDANNWPCGSEPPPPPAMVTVAPSGASLVMSAISLDGMGQRVVVSPGANLTLALSMTLTDTRCQMCIDQLEVGWVQSSTGHRFGCVFDNGVPNPGGVQANFNGYAIVAPTTPGEYDLRTNIGQNFSCNANGANNWWGGTTPAANTTIVEICVH